MPNQPPKRPLPKDWTSVLEEARELAEGPASQNDADQSDRMRCLFPLLVCLVDRLMDETEALDRERRTTQQKLKISQDQLVQSGKMAAVGQLAAGVAHEVNNPLQIILSRVQLLMMRYRDEERLGRDLQLIESNVKRISRIIRGLLDFARHNSGEEDAWQEIDLAYLVTQTSNLMQHLMEKAGIEVHIQVSDGAPPRVYGNVGEMEQVFLNLLINAQQAMPDGGTITIELRSGDGGVIARVRDTGEGISKAHLPHVFDPFFTTRQERGGTGLGLAIIRGIIEKHNGEIVVESQEGKGAVFTVHLPAGQQANGN